MKGKHMKKLSNIVCWALALAWLCPAPDAKAVVPAPDGGYPGFNTAEGANALKNLTTGVGNAAVGWYSLFSNTDGSFNTAVGAGTLLSNVGNQNTGDGTKNTAIGTAALLFNTTGRTNTAVGHLALENNEIGTENVAIGAFALANNQTGFYNTAIGVGALVENVGGNANTAIGNGAGFHITGSGNVFIGEAVLGDGGESNKTRIRNIGSTPIVGGANVVIAATGGIGDQILGYASSSRRYKEEIQPMDKASESLFGLNPVTFHAKTKTGDAARVKHYGLIAEEVATVNPDLVVFNEKGEPDTLRFDSINTMLLNEFLKEHRKNEAQQGKIEEQDLMISQLKSALAQQQKGFESKFALQEQHIAALIADLQMLAADIELNKAEARAVADK
jgi:hypothetical protein